jgi:hypothetical protein
MIARDRQRAERPHNPPMQRTEPAGTQSAAPGLRRSKFGLDISFNDYQASHRGATYPIRAAGVVGERDEMGYAAPSARKSASQFLRSHDPSISVLRRFAKAAGVPLGQLVRE